MSHHNDEIFVSQKLNPLLNNVKTKGRAFFLSSSRFHFLQAEQVFVSFLSVLIISPSGIKFEFGRGKIALFRNSIRNVRVFEWRNALRLQNR